jgi:anti-sigma28 factor (negative regulator of flagellin synthesis)
MVIRNASSAGAIDATASKPQSSAPAPRLKSDSVSMVDADRAEAVARAVRTNLGVLRTLQTAKVEKAIHAGNYWPSASELANRLVDDAEIDAQLQRTLGR